MTIRSRLRIRTRLRSAIHRLRPPKPKPLILMYHRIAEPPVDPWGLAVSPAHFEEHLHVLRRTRQPFPLAEFISRFVSGTLPSNAVALTFDDGYVDNLIVGKPLLAAAGIPATVFLPTGFIDRSEAFWSDELATFILLSSTPQRLDLVLRDQTMHFDFGADSTGNGTTPGDSSKTRHAALWTIWQALRRLEDEERRLTMAKLRSIFAETDHRVRLGRPMTRDEVRTIARDGLVTIGAHTVTHPVLSSLETAACRREITESKLACEELIGAPVAEFAYPYGDFDTKAREAVKAAGFTAAFSIQHGPATVVSDIWAMPRIQIRDVAGHAFEQALRLASVSG